MFKSIIYSALRKKIVLQKLSSERFFPPIQKTFKKEENGLDAQLHFEEFVHYLQDYEKDLKLVVKSINRKNAGVYFVAGVLNAVLVSVSLS